MKKTSINLNWTFCQEGSEERQMIRLPHDAMIYEARQPRCINSYNSGYYPGGSYIYEKELELDASNHNVLEFEGVMGVCEIWLNDVKVGENVYGYTTFLVDLDGVARHGKNHLRVVCDNSIEDVSRWYTGSGIYRDVWLHTSGQSFLEPQSVRYTTLKKNNDDALVEVCSKVVNHTKQSQDYELRVSFCRNGRKLSAAKNVTVAASASETVTFTMTISNADFWSAETPALYDVSAQLVTQSVTLDEDVTRFGIRTLEWKPGTGLLVNGVVTKLRGGCVHHDNGMLGACSEVDMERRKIRKLKEIGYNAIRSAHNPASPAQLQACDELGMYVMDESFDVWYKPKGDNQFQYSRFWDDWAKFDTQAMVKRGYNHPCIVLYSTGNEITETGTKKGIELAGLQRDWIREIDTRRPVTCAVNPIVTMTAQEPKPDEVSVDISTLAPRRGERDYEEEFTGSKAFNLIMTYLKKFMNMVITTNMIDKAITSIADRSDIAGYNYGVGRYGVDAKIHPDRLIVGTETTACDVDRSWSATCENVNVVGDFTWTAADHLGEAGIGCMDYADQSFYKKYPCRISGTGVLDVNMEKKPMAYFTQIVYGTRTAPYIIAEPFDHAGEKPSKSSWQFTNGVRSWDWTGCEGKKAKVWVFSSADHVELRLNGRKIGAAKPKKRPCHAFKIAYEPGRLEAIAYDAAGNEVGRDILQSSGSARKLIAQAERYGDLVYIPIHMLEDNGNTVYDCRTKVSIHVKNGELLAFGSGNPISEETYHETETTLYAGCAMAIVRASNPVTVTVSADSGLTVTAAE